MLRFSALQRAVQDGRTRNSDLGRKAYMKSVSEGREQRVKEWYSQGGVLAQEWIAEHHRLPTGEPLRWDDPWISPLYQALGHPWFERIWVEKAAQMGYTEALVGLTAFYTAYLRLKTGVGFETQQKQYVMVGSRFQKSFDHIQPIQDWNQAQAQAMKRPDTDSKKIISVGGVDIIFFHASVSGGSDSTYQTPSGLRSHPMDAGNGDEVSAWSDGMEDVLARRMEASTLPTKPMRLGSTPSYEGSTFDNQIQQAPYLFQFYCHCPTCEEGQFLDPFGNLLKKQVIINESGVPEERYVSRSGRPIDWYYRDEMQKVETAYIGCAHCGEELTTEAIAQGGFYDFHASHRSDPWLRKPGISLFDLMAQSVEEQKIIPTIAIRMPKLASKNGGAAPRLIRALIDSRKPADTIQQLLGKPISLGLGKIHLPSVLACVGRALPDPEAKPTIVTAGVDQGTYAHWLIVCEWYLADSPDRETQWLDGFCRVVYWGQIDTIEELDNYVKRYKINAIGIDQEPNYATASEYAVEHAPKGRFNTEQLGQVYLFDQLPLKGRQFQREVVGVKATDKKSKKTRQYKAVRYKIDRTYGLDEIRDRIYREKISLPAEMSYEAKDPGNLIHHYTTSARSPDGKWEEGSEPDHGFHAHCFASQAVHVHLFEPGLKKGIALTTMNVHGEDGGLPLTDNRPYR